MLLFALLVMANIPRALAQTKADLKNEIEQATELFKTKGASDSLLAVARDLVAREESHVALYRLIFVQAGIVVGFIIAALGFWCLSLQLDVLKLRSALDRSGANTNSPPPLP